MKKLTDGTLTPDKIDREPQIYDLNTYSTIDAQITKTLYEKLKNFAPIINIKVVKENESNQRRNS